MHRRRIDAYRVQGIVFARILNIAKTVMKEGIFTRKQAVRGRALDAPRPGPVTIVRNRALRENRASKKVLSGQLGIGREIIKSLREF